MPAVATHIPAQDLFARFVLLHEAMVNRPDAVLDEQALDYRRVSNRLVAEVAWTLASRARQATEAAAADEPFQPCDFLSELSQTAPRFAEILLKAMVALPPDELAELMGATEGFPLTR